MQIVVFISDLLSLLITFTKKIIADVYNFTKHKKDMKAFGVKLTVNTRLWTNTSISAYPTRTRPIISHSNRLVSDFLIPATYPYSTILLDKYLQIPAISYFCSKSGYLCQKKSEKFSLKKSYQNIFQKNSFKRENFSVKIIFEKTFQFFDLWKKNSCLKL